MYSRLTGRFDRRRVASVVAVVALGLTLRLHDLTGESLVNDEFHTIRDLRAFRPTLVEQLVNGRPLFYVLMKPWTMLAGYSETALRLPSAVFGALAVAAAYALGRELEGHRLGLASAVLVAVSPFFISHAQQARMYALLPLLSLAATAAFVRILRQGIDQRTAALYLATSTLLGYTHVYGLFLLAGHTVYVGLAGLFDLEIRFRGRPREWLAVQAGLALLLAPIVVAIAYGLFAGGGGGTEQVLPWNDPPGPYRVLLAVVRPLHLTRDVASVLLLGPALIGGVAIALRRDRAHGTLALPSTVAATAIVVSAALSYLITPIFLTRYLSGAAAVGAVAVAAAVDRIETTEARWLVAAGLLILVLQPLPGYYGDINKQQWRQGATLLEEESGPDDVVLVVPGHSVTNVDYYYDGPAPVETYNPWSGEDELLALAEDRRTVWLVVFRSLHGTTQKRTILDTLNRTRAPVEASSKGRLAAGVSPTVVRPYRSFEGFDVYRFDPEPSP